MIILFILISNFTFHSKKVFLKRTSGQGKEKDLSLEKTSLTKTKHNFRNISNKTVDWQFYLNTTAVEVFNFENKKEEATFVVLSIHKVRSDNGNTISSRILVFRGKVFWNVFVEEFKGLPGKHQNNSKRNIFAVFDVDTGFLKINILNQHSFKSYRNGFLSFRTDNFVEWMSSNKELFRSDLYVTKWRNWKKGGSANFNFGSKNKMVCLLFKFVTVGYHGVFSISHNACLVGARLTSLNSTITDKVFVRISEDNFTKIQALIESFG